MKKRKRILSLFVTFCTFFALLAVPRSAAMSAEHDDAVGVLSLPDIITAAEAAENGYVARVSAAETNLNTLVFRNADGTNTMRIFDHPVKFEDGGTVKDITLGIKASRGGFVSAQSPIRTVFPSRLSDGISLTYDGIEIEMIPEAASRTGAAAVLSGDGKKVTYAYGNRTALEYTLTYTGFKEDIVVEEYTGQTDFDFTLRTNGLILVSENGSYYLRDAAGKTKAALGDIIIFTADERNNAFGSMTHKTVTAGQEYVITVHVDDEYLKDEKTAYPIRIDPTVEIVYDGTNASAIEDVTLNSLGSSAPNSGSIYVGKRGNYGNSRTLMRFPGLILAQVGTADQIISARVELRDLMCYSTQLPISCYIFQSSWDISTVRWSNTLPDNYMSAAMDTKTVYYGNGDSAITGGTQRYSFNITRAVKRWKQFPSTQNSGVIFKTTEEIENGSTNISVCFASYNRASNKPSFTMVFSNTYLDVSDVSLFNNSLNGYRQIPGTSLGLPAYKDDNLQMRANCYGYAFKMIFTGDMENIGEPGYNIDDGNINFYYFCYKQQPGEFANKSQIQITNEDVGASDNYKRLAKWRNNLMSLYGWNANMIKKLVDYDMTALGYSTGQPITVTSSSMIPSAGNYSNQRLVALVTTEAPNRDYHFYVQNSDNTWSHKPGSGKATKACHCKATNSGASCTNPVDVLTNANILDHIADDYSDDYIFFFVSKPATVDYCHSDGMSRVCTSSYTPRDLDDMAGSSMATAKGILLGDYTYGKIDYLGDKDCYAIDTTRTSCVVFVDALKNGVSDNHPLKYEVYNSQGTKIASRNVVNGSGSGPVFFTPGQIYYVVISARDADSGEVGMSTFDHWREYRLRIN